MPDKEKNILSSWQSNAGNWSALIESNGIESRKLVTNDAIVRAITRVMPATVLDIGCGEGWLSKALFDLGIQVSGVDAIPVLIEKTREKLPGQFWAVSYESIYEKQFHFPELYDAAVINFALIGKESTERLLVAIPSLITAGGRLFIQTLHPHSRKALRDYETGWKTGSWDGLGDAFTNPYEWYFRTLEDWNQLLADCGFNKVIVHEVFHPHTGKEVSVIFECNT